MTGKTSLPWQVF